MKIINTISFGIDVAVAIIAFQTNNVLLAFITGATISLVFCKYIIEFLARLAKEK